MEPTGTLVIPRRGRCRLLPDPLDSSGSDIIERTFEAVDPRGCAPILEVSGERPSLPALLPEATRQTGGVVVGHVRWISGAVVVPPRSLVPTNTCPEPVGAHPQGGAVAILVEYVFLPPARSDCGSRNESPDPSGDSRREGRPHEQRRQMTVDIPSGTHDGRGKRGASGRRLCRGEIAEAPEPPLAGQVRSRMCSRTVRLL